MKDVLLIYLFVGLCSIVWASSDDNFVIQDEDGENAIDVDDDDDVEDNGVDDADNGGDGEENGVDDFDNGSDGEENGVDDEDNEGDGEENGVDDDDNGGDGDESVVDDDDNGGDGEENGVDDDDNGGVGEDNEENDDDNGEDDDDNGNDDDDNGNDDDDNGIDNDDNGIDDGDGSKGKQFLSDTLDPISDCWFNLNVSEHFKTMDDIDANYEKVRNAVQKSLKDKLFDFNMTQTFKGERGQAQRELNVHKGRMIPSGINLGGLCMLRMPESVLFFHRMKLRNNTYFHVEYLHNNMTNMVITINMWLNDLHLVGAFERSLTDIDPSVLTYAPTFGEVEFLLKGVKYIIEGRYSVVKGRFRIEMISSVITCDDILMMYINPVIESSSVNIEQRNLGSFLSRLKVDLDLWLKDYFNDYLVLDANMAGINLVQLAEYDKKKRAALQEFADMSIKRIGNRLRMRGAQNVRIPAFTFESIHTTRIKLIDGVLHGLDSMYRRSVVTGYKQKDIRKVDCEVGFSNLKIVYKYEALIPTGLPVLSGMLILSANEVTAHLALKMLLKPETLDLDIEFLGQMKPESLTVEGGANLMISNYRHLLEHQIIALMSNNLIYGVNMLKSLPGCEPFLPGQIVKKKKIDKKDGKAKNGTKLNLVKKVNYNLKVETDAIDEKSGSPEYWSQKIEHSNWETDASDDISRSPEYWSQKIEPNKGETDASVAKSGIREYWWQKRQPNKSQETIKKQLRSDNLKKNQTSHKKNLKGKKS